MLPKHKQEVEWEYKISARTIGKAKYQEIMRTYPPLRDNVAYRRFFAYLALGPHFEDEDTGVILVHHSMLAKMNGISPRHFNSRQFLEAFKRDVLPGLVYSRYSAEAGKCRAILETGIGTFLQAFLTEDEQDRLYIESGKVFNHSNQQALHNVYLQEAKSQLVQAQFADQKRIAAYLHSLPLSLFNQLVTRNKEEAKAVIHSLGCDNQRKQQLLRQFYEICDMPKPFYHPSGKNARLYSRGLTTIKKEVRQAFCKGLLELDITSCQCAIAAGLWHIESIQKILQAGKSLWTALLDWMEVPHMKWEIAKPILKEAVYAILYGMKTANVESHVTREFAGKTLKGKKVIHIRRPLIPKTKRFTDCPLIVDLFQAIQEAKEDIVRDGGYNMAYGFLPFDEETESIDSYLSSILQTYELAIIASCFELAQERKDFRIVLYQFDGISIDILRKNREQSILAAIQEHARKKALSMGIYATLQK